MSTLVDVFQPLQTTQVVEIPALPPKVAALPATYRWDPARFGEAQIQSLVRQIFFPGRPKPPRHVVFAAVDEGTYVAEICMEAAKALAAQVTGSVCVVEANSYKPELEDVFWRKNQRVCGSDPLGSLRGFSQQVADNLWLAPRNLLFGGHSAPAAALGRRMPDFRLEFDYTIWHAPPASRYSETAVLGNLSDGVALVVEANSTRRVAAQKTKETLQAAHTRLLGVVLSERTFPIPEKIYRKL